MMVEFGASCATDVTGFGLLGHLGEMAAQSGVTAEIYFDRIPVFDEVMDLISRGVISGGIERNREHASGVVDAQDDVTHEMTCVLCDPQTSGGLLMAVAAGTLRSSGCRAEETRGERGVRYRSHYRQIGRAHYYLQEFRRPRGAPYLLT